VISKFLHDYTNIKMSYVSYRVKKGMYVSCYTAIKGTYVKKNYISHNIITGDRELFH